MSTQILWTLVDGSHHLSAEVRPDPFRGWQVRLLQDSTPRYSERHPTLARARAEADYCRQVFLDKGWKPAQDGAE